MDSSGLPQPPMTGLLQRLGRNVQRYCGETIDIDFALGEIAAEARRHQWDSEVFFQSSNLQLTALHRAASRGASPDQRVYLSTGIHGDEPAGPLAVLELLRRNQWPDGIECWICPCLNPHGFKLNTRENARGIDLNREYLNPKAEEVAAHIAWLDRQPKFDLCLLLHEDWESHGFYVYEQNPDGKKSLAEAMIESVARVCPIDRSELIEGRPAKEGVIRPTIDLYSRPDWPEAFHVITHKTRLSYTLESPSDFPLSGRVSALVTAVEAALDALRV